MHSNVQAFRLYSNIYLPLTRNDGSLHIASLQTTAFLHPNCRRKKLKGISNW